jgi:hypothetical protein
MTQLFLTVFLASRGGREDGAAVNRHQPNDTMTTTAKRTPDTAYLAAYNAAIQALKDVETFIHDQPAPESETRIDWGNVGDMNRIAELLKEILPEA